MSNRNSTHQHGEKVLLEPEEKPRAICGKSIRGILIVDLEATRWTV